MKKMIFILAFGLGGPILAMQKETHITLIGKDNKKINIARETAQKIPTIQAMLTPGFQEAESGIIQFELFDASTLQSIVDIIEKVYTQAPILKLDPLFFEQTDKHHAYTPADIPEQVRNIIAAQGLQNNKTFMQAADFLGLDWVKIAIQGGKSIADLVAYNQLPQIYNNTLRLSYKGITSIVGLALLPHDISSNLQELELAGNQITSIADNAFANLNNLQKLDLSGNGLTSIPDNAFAALNDLQYLRLTSNRLTSIPDNAFTNLDKLQSLDLVNNKLTSIADNAFAGLNNLQILDLFNNKLTSISNNAFAGLNNLQQLGLSGNLQLDQTTKNRIRGQLQNVRIYF